MGTLSVQSWKLFVPLNQQQCTDWYLAGNIINSFLWSCGNFEKCKKSNNFLLQPSQWHLQNMSRFVTKPTKWRVCPAKTQISLGIHPVWSASLLSAWRKLRSLATHWVHNENSDQTGWMPKLIWVFAGCTDHFVGFCHETAYIVCSAATQISLCIHAVWSETLLNTWKNFALLAILQRRKLIWVFAGYVIL